MTAKTNTSILILRGAHTLSAVPEIVTKLKSADIVIIEAPGAKSGMAWLSSALDGASNDKEFAKRAEHTLTTPPNSNFFACRLGWALHSSGKHIILGDVHWDDDLPYEETSASYSPLGGFGEALQASIEHPNNRYAIWNDFFTRAIVVVKQRDALVATQANQIIEAADKYPMNEVLAKKDHCVVAIVQGYMHNSGLLLQDKYKVTEQFFDKENTDDLSRMPLFNYLLRKLKDAKVQFTNKEIDFMLLYTAISGLNMDDSYIAEKTNIDILIELSQTNDNPAWAANKQAMDELGSIDNCDEQELLTDVEAWLKLLGDNASKA